MKTLSRFDFVIKNSPEYKFIRECIYVIKWGVSHNWRISKLGVSHSDVS